MKEIQRLDVSDITEKFGLNTTLASFVFKPLEFPSKGDFEPHRSEMYGLGLVVKGKAELKVGLETYVVRAPGLVAIGPDEVRRWAVQDETLQFISLFFTEDFIVSGLSDAFFLKRFSFFKKSGNHFISLTTTEASSLTTLFRLVEQKNGSLHSNKTDSIQALLRVILLEVESLQKTKSTENTNNYSQAHRLTEKFKELLESHFAIHRDVRFYAEKLFVTTKHLSQTVKEQTGKTASELIDEIVTLEAKVLLQLKESTIAQISDQLNFANPSFFAKFFKRNTEMSPKEYRNSLSELKSGI